MMTCPPDSPQFSTKPATHFAGSTTDSKPNLPTKSTCGLRPFSHSAYSVFERNRQELLGPLLAPSSSWDLAMKLLPDVDDKARKELVAEATERLHNYVAGTMTLVDH